MGKMLGQIILGLICGRRHAGTPCGGVRRALVSSPSLHGLGIAAFVAAALGPAPSSADLVSPYGGETAPNFVELSVLEDRVRVVLEIEPSDYPRFVADGDGSLAARTGQTLQVMADGAALEPRTVAVDLRPRKERRTANSALPARPRSAEVIRAELEFPFEGRPDAITFAPPLGPDGRPLAAIGVMAEHMDVPVTDYRYLSQVETMRLDWDDPWFTAFDNRNLTRHHKSPLMSFVTVEPREVRHEVIFRLRDLEQWIDLGLGDATELNAAAMADIEAQAAEFFSSRNPLAIDGRKALPAAARVAQIRVGAEGLSILEDPVRTDRATALLGIVLSYPQPRLARDVSLRWDLFPEGVSEIPVTLTDPAGGVPAQIRRDDPSVTWRNYLTSWEEPAVKSITLPAGASARLPAWSLLLAAGAVVLIVGAVRSSGARRVAATAGAGVTGVAMVLFWSQTTEVRLPAAGTPDGETAQEVMAGLLSNIGTALLETEQDGFDTALAGFVPAYSTGPVGAEIRRGLSVTLPSGARGRIEKITGIAIETVTGIEGGGSQILARWNAEVSGGHWGHLHRLQVSYRGLLDVSHEAGAWQLDGLTVLGAVRAP
ncbi:hypothetical protein ACW9UR_23410 [Halovulum sp. GXIMD14794]